MKYRGDERVIYPLERYGFLKNSSLGRYRYRSAREGLQPHYHPGCLEICFLLSGRQIYHVKRQFFSIQGGDCFVTYPGETHSTGTFLEEKGSLVWLILGINSEKTSPDLKKLIHHLYRHRPRNFSSSSKISFLIRELLNILESRLLTLKEVRIRDVITALLLGCIDQSASDSHRATSVAISKALTQIQTSSASLNVCDLAQLTGLSVSRFKSKFKKETGFSPQDYILRKRVDQAIEMLRRPGARVTDVGFETGFSSSQYFATVFKRYTRRSPKSYLIKTVKN